MMRFLILLCLVSVAAAQDIELTARQDRLRNGEIMTSGIIRNVSTRTFAFPQVSVGYYDQGGKLVAQRSGAVKVLRLFSCRRLRPGRRARFQVSAPYDPAMTKTLIRFYNASGLTISHTRIR